MCFGRDCIFRGPGVRKRNPVLAQAAERILQYDGRSDCSLLCFYCPVWTHKKPDFKGGRDHFSSVRLFLGAYGVSSGGDGRHLPDLPDPVGRIFLQRYFKAEGVRWNCCLFSGRLSSCNSDLLSDVGCGNRRYRRFTDFCHSQRYPSNSPAVYAAWERR